MRNCVSSDDHSRVRAPKAPVVKSSSAPGPCNSTSRSVVVSLSIAATGTDSVENPGHSWPPEGLFCGATQICVPAGARKSMPAGTVRREASSMWNHTRSGSSRVPRPSNTSALDSSANVSPSRKVAIASVCSFCSTLYSRGAGAGPGSARAGGGPAAASAPTSSKTSRLALGRPARDLRVMNHVLGTDGRATTARWKYRDGIETQSRLPALRFH